MQQPYTRSHQRFLDLEIQQDVCPPESIDGLLWVPDQEQLPWHGTNVSPISLFRIIGGKQQQDLSLQRISVLELVHKDMGESLLEIETDSLMVTNQVPRSNEQVDKVEGAGPGLQLFIPLDKAVQLGLQESGQVCIGFDLELLKT